MARNAECDAVGVSYGAHDVAMLEGLAPAGLVHSVAELHAFFRQNG
ncbi:hypothetical protein GALL_552590 [mine drainage metagenome]|uniref:Uncharacterized protein n=1 Tax=mine drainage metagenome TaxID=410659 RepID=A0A1J5P5V5_9ZZZZ